MKKLFLTASVWTLLSSVLAAQQWTPNVFTTDSMPNVFVKNVELTTSPPGQFDCSNGICSLLPSSERSVIHMPIMSDSFWMPDADFLPTPPIVYPIVESYPIIANQTAPVQCFECQSNAATRQIQRAVPLYFPRVLKRRK